MLINSNKAFELLMQKFEQKPDLDSMSVLVEWADEIRDYDKNAIKSLQVPVVQFYTIQHGKQLKQSSDPSHQWTRYTPDAKYRIKKEDLAEWAKEHKLSMKEVTALVNGEVPDVRGYRVFWANGTLSKEYRDERDIWNKDADIGTVGSGVKPSQYSTPDNIDPTDYTPKGRK